MICVERVQPQSNAAEREVNKDVLTVWSISRAPWGPLHQEAAVIQGKNMKYTVSVKKKRNITSISRNRLEVQCQMFNGAYKLDLLNTIIDFIIYTLDLQLFHHIL